MTPNRSRNGAGTQETERNRVCWTRGRRRTRTEDRGEILSPRPTRELFGGYPEGVRWLHALLGPDDLPRLKYVEYSYWNELSGGTRRPADGAAAVRAGIEVFGVPNDQYFDGVRFMRRGGVLPPLILVSSDPDGDLVILEGHVRATVYALAGPGLFGPVKAMVGLHDAFHSWA